MRLAAKGAILTGLAFVIFVVPVVNITGSIGSKPFLDKPIRQPRKLKAVADSSDRAAMTYLSFKYEVFGKVQGVFFRAHTIERAQKLGVVGWVKNTNSGTVAGQVQGPTQAAEQMKKYLQTEGSPPSRIDRCDITEETQVERLDYKDFSKQYG